MSGKRVRSKEVKGSQEKPSGDAEIFISDEARERHEQLRDRKLLFERGFKLKNRDEEATVIDQIGDRGYQVLCKHFDTVVLNWVFEFYANAIDSSQTSVNVRGIYIDMSPSHINSFFRLRNVVEDDYSKLNMEEDKDKMLSKLCPEGVVWTTKKQKAFRAGSLTRIAKIWQYFICASILPTSHTSDISMDRAAIIYCILENLSVNFGNIISKELFKHTGDNLGAIIFPCLISECCKEAGVPLRDADVMRPVGHPISGPPILKKVNLRQGESSAYPTRFKSHVKVVEGEEDKKGKRKKVEEPTNADIMRYLKALAIYSVESYYTLTNNQMVIAKQVNAPVEHFRDIHMPLFDANGNLIGDAYASDSISSEDGAE